MLTQDTNEKLAHWFEPALVEEIQQIAQEKFIKSGEHLIDIDQTVRSMPFILSGTIKVSRKDDTNREILLYYVGANESCAATFTCCMQQRKSEVEAVAETDVNILSIPIDRMDSWMTKYSSWKSFIMNTFQQRFDELLKTIDQIAFQNLDQRLAEYLIEKSKRLGTKVIDVSHEQIAIDLATSRVVVSRLLKKLENDKKLLLYRTQIKLLNSMVT